MDDPDIAKQVVRDLKNGRRSDDVILEICEKRGVQWPVAQQFVQRVRVEHQDEISRHQNRFLVPVGVMTALAGLAIALGVVIATLDGWIIFPLSIPIPYLGNLLLIGLGLAMAAGGIGGLIRGNK